MTDKNKKSKIADILMDFYDEYDSNVINRPMIPNIYAGKILDSLQEEPVSNPIDFEQQLYKAFGQVKDFTLGMRIAKWFYDMGKNSQEPVSEELEEAAINHAATGEFLDNGKEMIDFQKEKSFKAGAKWKEKRIIEKVCEWIEETNHYFAPTNFNVENFKAYLKYYC